ncbi:MAG: O-methyltransferase [Gemmatimonadales bacterium]|nr:O-methyltransferase [Gemmatimonadales bacterium]
MIDIVHPRIERYLRTLIPPRDRVMAAMETRAGRERIPIVGPLVGRLFFQLALMVRARRVMELGSAIGYSTLWWARAVGPKGHVWYTDGDPESARVAAGYFRRAGLGGRVTLMVGDAVTSMRKVKSTFDIVFCDIDKHGYPAAFEAAWPRIRRGGLFVCDNTLWGGRVTGRAGTADRNTAGIQCLNRITFADEANGFAVLLPLRDGVTVVLKR